MFIQASKRRNWKHWKITLKSGIYNLAKYLWRSLSAKIQKLHHRYLYGYKYTPEVVQDPKINLKWMNTKKLEKTVHFVNVNLVEDIPAEGYPKISEASIRTCTADSRS